MSKAHHIPLTLARRAALSSQLLDGTNSPPKGKAGTRRIIEHLGYVQVDAMAVVQRAQHHTLWARQADYQEGYLHELQAKDRSVFEYWGHCASYLPTCDYRYYRPQMHGHRTPTKKWPMHCLATHGHLMDPILKRLADEGPLSLRELEDPTGTRSKGWSSDSPVQLALGMLCDRGDVMTTERRGTQKIYDLNERVIPPDTDTRMPTRGEQGRFFVRRALNAHGLAQEITIQDHLRRCDRGAISEALSELLDAGDVIEVSVEGVEGAPYYAFAATLQKAHSSKSVDAGLRILSPFDNLIARRPRIQDLFGFEYLLECYKPKHKRKYGYYVLPLLWNEEFVGRIDAKASRRLKTFVVHRLMLEPSFTVGDEFLSSLAQTLQKLATFTRCSRIDVVEADSTRLRNALRKRTRALSEALDEKDDTR